MSLLLRVRLLRVLVVFVAVGLTWIVFVSPIAPVDLQVFLQAARSVRHGATPYVDPSLPALWSGHAFVYPYLTAWWFVPLTVLPAHTASVVFFLMSVLACALSARLLAGSACGLVAVLFATCAEPVVRGLQLGTLNAVLLLALALAWRYRHNGWVLVPALVCAVVAKLFLLPMVAWLLLSRRRRSGLLVLAAAVISIVAGCWIAHLSPTTYLRMLSVLSTHEAEQSSSMTALLLGADVGQRVATVLAWVAAAIVLLVGAYLTRRRGGEQHLFAACVIASIVASPIVWSHYYTLLVAVPLVLRWRPGHQMIALVCSWLVLTPVASDSLHVAQPWRSVGVVVAGAIVLLALSTRAVRARRAAEGCVR